MSKGKSTRALAKIKKPPEECTLEDIKHKKKRAFLKAIYETGGSITKSANLANVSAQSHYNWLASDPHYAHVYKIQDERAIDLYVEEARRRAVDGVDEPIYQGGQLVGSKTKYSDRLLEVILKKKDPSYRDYQPQSTNVGIWGEGNVNIEFNIPRPPNNPDQRPISDCIDQRPISVLTNTQDTVKGEIPGEIIDVDTDS